MYYNKDMLIQINSIWYSDVYNNSEENELREYTCISPCISRKRYTKNKTICECNVFSFIFLANSTSSWPTHVHHRKLLLNTSIVLLNRNKNNILKYQFTFQNHKRRGYFYFTCMLSSGNRKIQEALCRHGPWKLL